MERFVIIVNGWKPLTIITKHSILDVAAVLDPPLDYAFFLKNLNPVNELLSTMGIFYSFTGLKPNLSKCEISGIGALKGVTVAVCGIKCIDLTE